MVAYTPGIHRFEARRLISAMDSRSYLRYFPGFSRQDRQKSKQKFRMPNSLRDGMHEERGHAAPVDACGLSPPTYRAMYETNNHLPYGGKQNVIHEKPFFRMIVAFKSSVFKGQAKAARASGLNKMKASAFGRWPVISPYRAVANHPHGGGFDFYPCTGTILS